MGDLGSTLGESFKMLTSPFALVGIGIIVAVYFLIKAKGKGGGRRGSRRWR